MNQLQKENDLKDYLIYGIIVFFVLIIIIIILLINHYRQRNRQHRMELRDKIVRSQLNPHFIFNALIAIQGYVYHNKPDKAGLYITQFAKLMRLFLQNSRTDFIPLSREIETLKYYVQLQHIRFKDKFEFVFKLSDDIDKDKIMISPGLAQPFIENAIEHGIQNKDDRGKIELRIFMLNNYLHIEIEDDGIGIENRKHTRTGERHLSLSTLITHERIDNMNRKGKGKIKFRVGLAKPGNKYPGTLVVFMIPESFVFNANH